MPAVIYLKIEIHDKIQRIRISAIFLVQPDLFLKNLASLVGNVDTIVYSSNVLYNVSKKTGPLRLIGHNFTSSQCLLIIFGRDRPYSVLN